MSTIGSRIKAIRKEKGYTQQRLADLLGVKQNTIATYEMDRSVPVDSVLFSFCREFNVDETWLRTGAGQPYIKLSRDEEMAQFVGDVMRGGSDSDIAHVLHTLAGATPEEIHAICQFALRLAKDFRQD